MNFKEKLEHFFIGHTYSGNSWKCIHCNHRMVEFYGIKDICCTDENMCFIAKPINDQSDELAQCLKCNRIFTTQQTSKSVGESHKQDSVK